MKFVLLSEYEKTFEVFGLEKKNFFFCFFFSKSGFQKVRTFDNTTLYGLLSNAPNLKIPDFTLFAKLRA